jgi:signal transduction histidine kinase
VRVELRGEVPPLEADPARLEQVLVNLLSNAAKYSFPETEILVEVEPREREVMVSVTNLGQGIPPEEQEAIFTRFRRARAATEAGVPGLGLGLYITKGLVEAHGGRIWVESEVGKSTTFRFTLPLGSPGP